MLLAANLHFNVYDFIVDLKLQIESVEFLTPTFWRYFDVQNLDVLNLVAWYFEQIRNKSLRETNVLTLAKNSLKNHVKL